jgi:hypothetical protein
MEEIISSLEFDIDEKWNGDVNLTNGNVWFIKLDVKKLIRRKSLLSGFSTHKISQYIK